MSEVATNIPRLAELNLVDGTIKLDGEWMNLTIADRGVTVEEINRFGFSAITLTFYADHVELVTDEMNRAAITYTREHSSPRAE